MMVVNRSIKLVSTTAQINAERNYVIIDTRNIVHNSCERDKIDTPWWVIGSAAFLFEIDDTQCVALVQRTKNTTNPCKWALIPAGVAESILELRYPSITILREASEELNIIKEDKNLNPLDVSCEYKQRQLIIYDKSNDGSYVQFGDIYCARDGKKAYFLKIYKIKQTLTDFVLFDGEENGSKTLNRRIALVPINKLQGVVRPIKLYKDKEEKKPEQINLTGCQTPTLEWFRGKARALL